MHGQCVITEVEKQPGQWEMTGATIKDHMDPDFKAPNAANFRRPKSG